MSSFQRCFGRGVCRKPLLPWQWVVEPGCTSSDAILAEYEEVLRRPRLNIPGEKVNVALAKIREAACVVHPTQRVSAAADPHDDIFLECAQSRRD